MTLPTDYKVAIGKRLVDTTTGREFTVLCSCASSQPREHTRRFIDLNRDRFDLPTAQPAQPTLKE